MSARRRLSRILKRAFLVLLGVAAVVAVVLASLPQRPRVDVVSVRRDDLRVLVEGDGKTRVQDRYVITSPLYGNLARIELEPGDDVQAGDVLARISPLEAPLLDQRSRAELEARVKAAEAARRQAQAAIDRATAAAEFADKEQTRARELAAQGALSAQAVDQTELEARHAIKAVESARFGARVAQHELEMAKAALGRYRDPRDKRSRGNEGQAEEAEQQLLVESPVQGRVLKIMRESEGVVNPGEPLLELGDPSALEIVVDVLTEDAVEIEVGDPVRIDRWGGDDPLRGTVRLIEPQAFTKVSALGVDEQRVNVVVALEDAPEVWKRLGDAYRVEADITVWEGENVLVVPAGALHRIGRSWGAFVVDAGVVREVEVEIGRRGGLDVEVVEGLQEGDRVIVHPSDAIADGVEVTLR